MSRSQIRIAAKDTQEVMSRHRGGDNYKIKRRVESCGAEKGITETTGNTDTSVWTQEVWI